MAVSPGQVKPGDVVFFQPDGWDDPEDIPDDLAEAKAANTGVIIRLQSGSLAAVHLDSPIHVYQGKEPQSDQIWIHGTLDHVYLTFVDALAERLRHETSYLATQQVITDRVRNLLRQAEDLDHDHSH